MKHVLKLEKQLTLEELQKEIERGGRFVVFEYCISLVFAVTLRRFSPAILITGEESFSKYKRKYNLISWIFGWWGFPWGPSATIKSLRVNKKGGLLRKTLC